MTSLLWVPSVSELEPTLDSLPLRERWSNLSDFAIAVGPVATQLEPEDQSINIGSSKLFEAVAMTNVVVGSSSTVFLAS